MTVTAVRKDPDKLTLTLDAEFDATPERVWQLWADPRQLERWWGPPSYPATFTSHDLEPAGAASYYMTGPDGDTPLGYWEIVEAEPPRRLDVHATASRTPTARRTTTCRAGRRSNVTIEPIGDGRTRMSIESIFPDAAAMEQLLAMGMEEGLTEAVGQIDAILAEDAIADVRALTDAATEPEPRTETTMTTTTDRARHETLEVPGRDPHLRRPPERRDDRAAAVPHRLADGRGRVRHARAATSPTARSSPTTRAATASAAPPTTRPRRSRPRSRRTTSTRIIEALGAGPGRPVREQRRRHRRPGARREVSRTTSGSLVAHEPPLAVARPGPRAGTRRRTAAIHDAYMANGCGAGMAQVHAGRDAPRPVHGRGGRGSPRRTRRCSACRPRTTARAPT